MLKITSPYPYQEFKRKSVNGKRLYENPYGNPVPSVTTILDKTKPQKQRQALANWKKRVGEKEAQRIVTEASDNGRPGKSKPSPHLTFHTIFNSVCRSI